MNGDLDKWRLKALRIGEMVFDAKLVGEAPRINHNIVTPKMVGHIQPNRLHVISTTNKWTINLLASEAKGVSFFMENQDGDAFEIFFYHLVVFEHKNDEPIWYNPGPKFPPTLITVLPGATAWRAIELQGLDGQQNIGYLKVEKD